MSSQVAGKNEDRSDKDGPVKDGAVKDGAVKDGPVKDGAVKECLDKDGPGKDGPVKDGPAKDGSIKDGLDKDGKPSRQWDQDKDTGQTSTAKPSFMEKLADNLYEYRKLVAVTDGGHAEELPVNPEIIVNGIGPVEFPLSQETADQLISVFEKAPYGKGTETVIDEEVRKTWQLNPSNFSINNATWESCLKKLVDNIGQKLRFDGNSVEIRLHMFLLYTEGSHFMEHRDNEKSPGMFATLIVQLPSIYEGGSLVVQHDDMKSVYDFHSTGSWSSKYSGKLFYAAHFLDVKHKVETVTKGHRCVLVYKLCWNDSNSTRYLPSTFSSEIKNLLLNEWQLCPEILVFPLNQIRRHKRCPDDTPSLERVEVTSKGSISALQERNVKIPKANIKPIRNFTPPPVGYESRFDMCEISETYDVVRYDKNFARLKKGRIEVSSDESDDEESYDEESTHSSWQRYARRNANRNNICEGGGQWSFFERIRKTENGRRRKLFLDVLLLGQKRYSVIEPEEVVQFKLLHQETKPHVDVRKFIEGQVALKSAELESTELLKSLKNARLGNIGDLAEIAFCELKKNIANLVEEAGFSVNAYKFFKFMEDELKSEAAIQLWLDELVKTLSYPQSRNDRLASKCLNFIQCLVKRKIHGIRIALPGLKKGVDMMEITEIVDVIDILIKNDLATEIEGFTSAITAKCDSNVIKEILEACRKTWGGMYWKKKELMPIITARLRWIEDQLLTSPWKFI